MVMPTEVTDAVDDQVDGWFASQPGAGTRAAPARVAMRSDSGHRLDTHLLTILAVVGALPAVRLPVAWLGVCALTSIVLCAVAAAPDRTAQKGSADLVVVPVRAVGRLLRGCINPLNWLKAVLGALASLAVGAGSAAVIAAARWIVAEGPDGILAAIRMGVWAHALTYAAVFACYLLLSGVGRTHECRAVALYRRTRGLPEVALAGVAILLAAASVTVALAGPRVDVGFARGSDGLGWVPPGLRTSVDGLRDDLVDAELEGIAQCLSGDDLDLWTYRHTAGNSPAAPDVATLTADPGRAPDPRALATTALVAHNHLAPWVEAIEITIGDQPALMVTRAGLPTGEPLVDASDLRAHTIGAPEWLTVVAPSVDHGRVLTCSARTPL
jgi:hypothetical protein